MVFEILYPLLFSCIPIFTFLSSNIKEVDKKNIFYIFIVNVIVILSLWFILKWTTDIHSNIISGIIFYTLIWFYTPWYKLNRFKSRYSYQYIIKYVAYALLVCVIVYTSFIPLVLTIIFSLIILLNIIYIISNSSKISSENIKEDIIDINLNNNDKPDIYHIILDGYLGKEALNELVNYDNSEFYSELHSIGFNIYNNIYSNYNYTAFSLPSMFNMGYFNEYMSEDELNSNIYKQDKLQYGFLRTIKSKLIFSLKKAGYKIMIRGETIFLEEVQNQCETVVDVQSNQSYAINANATISTFLKTTIISNMFMISKKANKDHASYLLNVFHELGNDHKMPSPTYSLFHILAPHPPFCFNSDGSINEKYSSMVEYPAYDKDGLEAYKNHMLYVNKLSIEALSKLIENIQEKNHKAIILVHGDHGLILNSPDKPSYNTLLAIYKYKFDDDKDVFQDNITLVNVMPYLFNYIFNTNIPIKSNQFYFCDLTATEYINSDVTNIISKFINKD